MIREYFNDQADSWDSHASERNPDKLEQMANRLDLKPGSTVLDLGTGTGVFLPYLLKKVGSKGQVIGLDVAEKMLLQAKLKDFKGKIHFVCADVDSIPLRAGVCDAAVCYSSFPHFQDKIKALREIHHVLKKGANIFICHTSGRNTINRIHASVPLLHCDLLPDGTDMARLLETAGFSEIGVEDGEESYFAFGRRPSSG